MARFKLQVSALALAAALAIAPGMALADGVDDLMRSVRSDLTEIGNIQKERDELVARNEDDMAAFNAMKSSYDSQMNDAKSMKAQWDAQIDRRYEAFNGMVDDFNNQCAADIVGELEEAAYNACSARKAELEPYIAQGRAAIKAEDDNWYANVMEPKIKLLERQEAGMDEIAARMKARFDQTNAMDIRLKALRSHALQQLAGLGSACESATSPEAVKYCNAIDWDGAGAGAPTIEEVAPIALMWPGP